jgi:hypothetical protein
MMNASKDHGVQITEFTIAPAIQVAAGLPYHEWFVEFETMPADMTAFATTVNNYLRTKNIYYEDLMAGGILQPLKISVMQKNAFIEYMKSIGKLGGQNKVPRLGNDRKIADALQPWVQA